MIDLQSGVFPREFANCFIFEQFICFRAHLSTQVIDKYFNAKLEVEFIDYVIILGAKKKSSMSNNAVQSQNFL